MASYSYPKSRLDRTLALRAALSPVLLLAGAVVGCSESAPEAVDVDWPIATTDNAPPMLGWLGEEDCCGEDPHAVHGAPMANGNLALVGKAGNDSGTSPFLVSFTPNQSGGSQWATDSDIAFVAAPQMPGAYLQVVELNGRLLVAGTQGESPQATLWAFDSESGEQIFELTLPATVTGDASAFESVALDGEGGLFVGGVVGSTKTAFEGFKSYGNVVQGTAILLRLTAEQLSGDAAPSDELWHQQFPGWASLKSIKAVPNGGVIAVAANEEETSGLLRIDDEGQLSWRYLEEGPYEITDVDVDAREPLGFILSGHGGGDSLDGRVARVDDAGNLEWSQSFGNSGSGPGPYSEPLTAIERFIYDECWGVQVDDEGTAYLACGSGIEGCEELDFDASKEEIRGCEHDPRRGWRSLVVAYSAAGEELWRRTEAFSEGEAASESAGEFLFFGNQGELHVVEDHDFGVGVLSLDLSVTEP